MHNTMRRSVLDRHNGINFIEQILSDGSHGYGVEVICPDCGSTIEFLPTTYLDARNLFCKLTEAIAT